GAPRPSGGEPQVGGIVGWLLAKQSEFYREMSSTLRAAKSDGSAVWTLFAISFAYGIFHAAGPGHGKAVISSYLVANQETARRVIMIMDRRMIIITSTRMCMTNIAVTPTPPSPANSPVRAAGGADSVPSSRSASGPARARS